MRRAQGIAVLVVAGLTLAAVAQAGGRATTITVYSGQHPQTVAALVSAFEKQTGIKVAVRSDDENVLDAQIVQEGKHSPADVFITENSPPLEDLQQRGLLSRVNASTLATTSAKYSSPQKRWIGVSARVSVMVYNTKALEPGAASEVRPRVRRPEVEGQARALAHRDRLPAARHGGRRALRRGAHGQVAEGPEEQRGRPHLPRQRDAGRRGQRRPRRRSASSTTTTGTACGTSSARSKIHSAEQFFAPGDPGYVIDVSGAGILASSSHQAEDQRFLAFLVGKQGAGDHRPRRELRVSARLGRRHAPSRSRRSSSSGPTRSRSRQLGNGQAAIGLLRQAGIL